MNDETRKLIEDAMKNADPELVAKYGNPLDPEDPRAWKPTERAERGVSLEDQVKYLNLDVEGMSRVVAQTAMQNLELRAELNILQEWVALKMRDDLMEKFKTNPEEAAKDFVALMGGTKPNANPGSWGPLENTPDASVRYAGSAKGLAPDQMVETPDGIIRADEIPGYKNDPNWAPSPDWSEANCMCPGHVAKREHEKGSNPFGIDPFNNDDPPNGMYL